MHARRHLMIRSAITLVIGLALGGCGGTAGRTKDETSSVPTLSPSPVIRTVDDFYGFVAAGGNLGCVMDEQSVRCDIERRDWQPPKDTSGCEYDYGQGIFLNPGETAKFVCAGDTALHGGSALASGHGIRNGHLTCVVAGASITCTDDEGGHGFEISAKR